METTPHISPKADSRVVWLDVVRLIAMFTVVCCHLHRPFQLLSGTAPNVEDIKFWGAVLWGGAASVRTSFCDDNGSFVAPVRGMHPYSIRNVFHVCFFRFLSGR